MLISNDRYSTLGGPKKRPRVVFWNSMPAPYLRDRFNAVAERGNLDFEAWFSARSSSHRNWEIDEREWGFKHRYPMETFPLPAGASVRPAAALLSRPPDLLVSLYAQVPFLLGWLLARRAGVRTAFRVVPTFSTWVRRTALKEAAKAWLFPRVDGFFVPGADGAQQVRSYGGKSERIHRVTQSVDIPFFASGRTAQLAGRDETRRELGLRGTTFLYVGRLWRPKGLEYLLEAFRRLQRSTEDVSLLLVGDGTDEEHFRHQVRGFGLQNVAFAGFVQKEGLPRMYAAADAFVFPTLGDPYGLVVDEAMASSLPVISTTAVGEISARIDDEATGYIVPPADPSALLLRMEEVARSAGLRAAMGEAAARKIAHHTPDRWAEDFELGVERILTMPRVAA